MQASYLCVGGLGVQAGVLFLHFLILLCCFASHGGKLAGADSHWGEQLTDNSTISGLVFVFALLKIDFLLILSSGLTASMSSPLTRQMETRVRCLALVGAFRDASQVAVSVSLKVVLSQWSYLSMGTVMLSVCSLLLTSFRYLLARHMPALDKERESRSGSSNGNFSSASERSSVNFGHSSPLLGSGRRPAR